MNKYTIIGVIVLMSISLLGVVGLQLYWINDAIQVKQAQFDHAVNSALTSTVDKLETQEAVTVVTQNLTAWQQPTDSAETTDATIASPKPQPKQKPKAKPKQKPAVSKQTQPNQAPQPERLQPYPATTPEIVWLRNNPTVKGTIISGKKGLTWVKLPNGDTILVEEHHLIRPGTHYTEVTPAVKKPEGVRIKMQMNPEKRMVFRSLEKVAPKNAIRMADSLALHAKSFNFSVDTLLLVASRLDSLQQVSRANLPFKISDQASLRVRNDSVFVIRKGERKPEFIHISRDVPTRHMLHEQAMGLFEHTIKGTPADPMALRTKEARVYYAQQPQKQTINSPKPVAKEVKQPLPQLKTEKTTTDKLETKKEKLNDVVQKMVVEYVAKDAPLQQRLNLQHLPDLLQEELHKQGIALSFGYHVVTGKNDTVIAKTIEKPAKNTHYYAASLFPNDLIQKQDYLAVYFPDSRSYALRSLWGMLALSGFFTLVIIATFGTTIHIIYKQKKLSEMKNDFINNMTHEFKTPIATISLATDSIANPKVYEHPEKIQYYTNIIRQENKRMNAQVENVLQIALLEKNEFKMKLQPVDVHLLIVKAIESIRLQVEQRLGSIHVQLDALKHELHSDEVHLFNAICNLLDNANKYSPATPEISLFTRNVDGGLVIAVNDKGMGMSKDTQQRVFEKFYRVPTGNLHNVKGFGLGLSYVKAIVEAHHGNIRLWSEPGKGSRFEIFLPMKQEAL